jgi:3-oxoacyl-[acyl-carrier protein] reductase
VLGGGGGLGRAVAMALAAEGSAVMIAGRTPEKLAETGALIEASGSGSAQTAVVELGDPASVDALAAAAGAVDILLLNGGGPAPADAASVTVSLRLHGPRAHPPGPGVVAGDA